MRVAHIVAHPPFREGTGTVAYYNACILQKMGCEVTVYAPKYNLRPSESALDFYEYLPSWLSIGNAFLTPQILSLKLKTFDIIHLHYPYIFGSELVLLKLLGARIPLVITYHNDLIGGGVRRPAFFIYNRFFTPLILRRARKIAATSLDYAAGSICCAEVFQKRKNDFVGIPNGVAIDEFHPDINGSQIRAEYGFHDGDIVLLFVSSLDSAHVIKGLPYLLTALSELNDPDIKLLVVGDGDMRTTYERQTLELDIEERVTYLGKLPRAELPPIYAASDIVAVPSKAESFGLVIAEGMATGKPVIGSKYHGIRTVVIDGEQGFLVSYGDVDTLVSKIEKLAHDPELRRIMGKRGRDRIVDHYSWEHAGKRLMALYEDVLSTP